MAKLNNQKLVCCSLINIYFPLLCHYRKFMENNVTNMHANVTL